MAVRTSVASGLWSAAGTWNTGVPIDGDSFVIAAGHVVTFDVDQSAFVTGMLASTITGDLQLSTAPGAYYLKMAGNVTGTGRLLIGDSATPYPSTCTFTCLMNGNFSWQLSASGAYQIYGHIPAIRSIKLSAAEAAGQTVLSVDTDVSADPDWISGAVLQINDINGIDSEEKIFSSATASEITITTPLATPKIIGAEIFLVSRNVTIMGTSNSTPTTLISGGTDGVFRCRIYKAFGGITDGLRHTISGVVSGMGTGQGVLRGNEHNISGNIVGNNVGILQGNGHTLSGHLSGCSNGIVDASGCIISGKICGCNNAISRGGGHLVTGEIYGNTVGINSVGGFKLLNANLHDNVSNGVNIPYNGVAYNTIINGGIKEVSYAVDGLRSFDYFEAFNHDQIVGDFRSWTRGGITSKNAAILDSPRGVDSYNTVLESATYLGFWQQSVVVPPGQKLNITAYLRKDASMAFLPRVLVFAAGHDPLITGESPTLTQIMTDSVDTWESYPLTLTNSLSTPQEYIIRFEGMNATGNVYSDLAFSYSVVNNQNGRAGCRRCN